MDFEVIKPAEIEKRSFEIITDELKEKGIAVCEENEMVVKRVIHASADFEYAKTLVFSHNVVEKAKKILKSGKAVIVTDTQMAKSGVNKSALASLKAECHCFMSDEDVALSARVSNSTRASASAQKAASLFKNNEENVIYAVGNAPTALITLCSLKDSGVFSPAIVIGVPVGFVNVVQSKDLAVQTFENYIVATGRKGGSTIAAAILNALMYECVAR